MITMRDPGRVWKTLIKLHQAVLESAIDDKLSRLQQIRIGSNELVVKYTKCIDGLGYQLRSAGEHASELGKKRAFAAWTT